MGPRGGRESAADLVTDFRHSWRAVTGVGQVNNSRIEYILYVMLANYGSIFENVLYLG